MKYSLSAGLLALMATSVSAHSIVVVIPVSISGLPPDVFTGQLRCTVADAAGDQIGETTIYVPLVNGSYQGQVRTDIRPAGYPVSANPLPDAHSYRCSMDFHWHCTSATGELATCVRSSTRGASLFERQAGAPYRVVVEGTFDPADAVELPRLY